MKDGDEAEAKRLTLRRALRAPEFWLLTVAALVAAGGVRVWIVVPLAVAGLSISSLPKYIDLWPGARAMGASRIWWSTVALSMFNNVAASCAAFLLGIVHGAARVVSHGIGCSW